MGEAVKQILLLLMLAGCSRTIERILAEDYKAPTPIMCIAKTPKYDGLWACRDGANKFWICSKGEFCMPVEYPQSVFAVPVAEVVP